MKKSLIFSTQIAIAILGLFGDKTISLAEPVVELIGYKSPGCVGVGIGPLGPKTTKLTNDKCVNLPLSLSYKLKQAESCGQGFYTDVEVYEDKNCQGIFTVHFDVNEKLCFNPFGPVLSARFSCIAADDDDDGDGGDGDGDGDDDGGDDDDDELELKESERSKAQVTSSHYHDTACNGLF